MSYTSGSHTVFHHARLRSEREGTPPSRSFSLIRSYPAMPPAISAI